MRPVRRDEILDWQSYNDVRAEFRAQVMAAKALRRVHLGESLTLLFENPLTVRYQVQEMILTERIVREADIRHEIDTYNELLGGEGELGCTLLVEIDDAATRDVKLRAWWSLPEKLALRLVDGTRVPARFDPRQRGEGRLSSVQYLAFPVGEQAPVGACVELPDLALAVEFTPETRQALADDLAGVEPAARP
jgi:hypothetical protein